jgi:hypothetical protein
MEITNRQLVSDVITELRSMNIDDRISNRFVLSRLKDKARVFIKQDSDSRRLLKVTGIWKTIKCFHMCEANAVDCGCDIPDCQILMKSKHVLPKSFDTNYGTLVKVFTVNGAKEYIQTTLAGYIDIKNREYQNKSIKYFWIDDGHIYIPDSHVEEVMVIGLFENPEQADILNDKDANLCLKPLDSLFPCPGHLLDPVKKDTIIELAKIYKGITEDEKPNQNSNIKA